MLFGTFINSFSSLALSSSSFRIKSSSKHDKLFMVSSLLFVLLFELLKNEFCVVTETELWLSTLLLIDVCLYSAWLFVFRNEFVSTFVSLLIDSPKDAFNWLDFCTSVKVETKLDADEEDEDDEGYVEEETRFEFEEVEELLLGTEEDDEDEVGPLHVKDVLDVDVEAVVDDEAIFVDFIAPGVKERNDGVEVEEDEDSFW